MSRGCSTCRKSIWRNHLITISMFSGFDNDWRRNDLAEICKLTYCTHLQSFLLSKATRYTHTFTHIPPALQFNAQTNTALNHAYHHPFVSMGGIFLLCLPSTNAFAWIQNYFRIFIELIFDLTAMFSLSLVLCVVCCVKPRAVILYSRVPWIPVITLIR